MKKTRTENHARQQGPKTADPKDCFPTTGSRTSYVSRGGGALTDNLSQRDWQNLARSAGFDVRRVSLMLKVSTRQLQRYTRQLFGLCPRQFLQQQRMKAAGELLDVVRCIKLVAIHFDFKQVSHFSRVFKQHFGKSPRAYLAWKDGQSYISGSRKKVWDGIDGFGRFTLQPNLMMSYPYKTLCESHVRYVRTKRHDLDSARKKNSNSQQR